MRWIAFDAGIQIDVTGIRSRVRAILMNAAIAVVGIVFARIASSNFHIARVATDMLAFLQHFWFVHVVVVVSGNEGNAYWLSRGSELGTPMTMNLPNLQLNAF